MKLRSHFYIALFVLTFPSLAFCGGETRRSFDDVRILEASVTGITFEYTPAYEGVDTLSAEGKMYRRLRFVRMSDPLPSDAGLVDLRTRTITIAVPGRIGNVVSVLAADYESIAGFEYAPVPTRVPHSAQYPDGKKYEERIGRVSAFSPINVAMLDQPFGYGGVTAACVKIAPVQYNASARTVRKYTRLVIRVAFGVAENRLRAGEDIIWVDNSLLNAASARQWLVPRRSLSRPAVQNSMLATGSWIKIEIKDDGMYKIDSKVLKAAGIDIGSIGSFQNLRVYGGTGCPLPASLTADYPSDLSELSVRRVDVNGNGTFDEGDYVLFFGHGTRWWTYTGGPGDFIHHINPYTNSNYYFVRVGSIAGAAKEASVVTRMETPTLQTDKTIGKVFFHEEKTNYLLTGLQWVSAVLNSGDKRVIANKLNGYVTGTPVVYKYEMLSRAINQSTFTLEETGALVSTLYEYPLADWDPNADYANINQDRASVVPTLSDQWSSLRVTYNADGGIGQGWIAWIEILYQQQLAAVNNELLFTSPDANAVAEFALTGYTSNDVSVFDVTDPMDAKRITTTTDQVLGSLSFRDSLHSGGVKWYWAGTAATYRQPVSIQALPNSNIRGSSNGADFIIVTHGDFKSEALRLKAFKEAMTDGALSTMVVDVDTLYNEFGFGCPDPVAIRNFMRFTQSSQWTIHPRYLLLFGDASCDYKSILGTDKSWIPTYETDYSLSEVGSYAYDDFFVTLTQSDDDAGKITLSVGRLPARSAAQARLFVDRIIAYEGNPTFGTWKNLITIVADDNVLGTGAPDDAQNLINAETLAENDVPLVYDVDKIYSGEYPATYTSAGRRKPEVRAAIIDQVNRGTLILNYTGHGNPTVWAHESILTIDDVKTQFFNADKLAFVVAATCDWGRFDEPGAQSSAEEMLANERGGGIGVFSALRPVYDGANAALNQNLYDNLLPQNASVAIPRLGDAIVLAKNAVGDVDNKRKYHLLGDPSMRLAIPRLSVSVDSINGKALSSIQPDTIHALSQVVLQASVRTTAGNVMDSLQGTAYVTLFDAEMDRSFADNGTIYTYKLLGGAIYKGTCSVVNGRIKATCFVPKDIAYLNQNGRVALYMMSGSKDGRGASRDIIVGGTTGATSTDRDGPALHIYMDSRSFRQGDLVGENPTMIVDLQDSSGINAAGSGIGHRFEAWLDGGSNSIDLGDYYRGTLDSYQQGVIEYPMAGLPDGRHTLKVRAWDAYNNSSNAETDFMVAATTTLSIQNIFNLPNPARSHTNFTFQQNQQVPVDVHIKVYSIAGRLIQTVERFGVPDRFVSIPWDCRDRDGDPLGNGVYLYKVTARTSDGKYSSEAIGKLVIAR
jgi:hypothetical protein